MQNLWTITLDRLRKELNQHAYETWFEPTEFRNFKDNTLYVKVPNNFFKEWLNENYDLTVKKILLDITTKPVSLVYEINDLMEDMGKQKSIRVTTRSNYNNNSGQNSLVMLNQKYRFDTFVVGNGNQLAHAASRAVAEAPSVAYNPLFLYGGVGLGKTHLMHSIGHTILERFPAKKLVYIPAEQFMNEMIDAFRFSKVQEFRERYRSVDVLMIDDIQNIANKERTQIEFFHTFNTLYESQKQIIISSDLFPKEIPTLEERLRSRFEWGLIADIQAPDTETKVAILYKKAEMKSIVLPADVAMFIAENIKSNIRELEGCLSRVEFIASLSNRKIDLEFTKQVLKDIVEPDQAIITIEMIQKTVAEHFGIKLSSMRSKTRTKDIAFPRQIAMFLCRELTSESLPSIGKKFGGKDHSTVIYACDKIKTNQRKDINLRKNIDLLKTKLTGSKILQL